MDKTICVENETGKLKTVLLHRPGAELEQLIPENFEQLLFDDIPFLEAARREHDYFALALQNEGAEVVYLETLAARALKESGAVKERFIEEFIDEGGSVARHYKKQLKEFFSGIRDEKELILKTMSGVGVQELEQNPRNHLFELRAGRRQFALEPMPNLYFTRDPLSAIGKGICVNRMRTGARGRETIYGRYVFQQHPDYRGKVRIHDDGQDPFSIEGGDILNLSRAVLAVGLSQRTSAEAVDCLARTLFWEETSAVNRILAVDIPDLRAYMHLDTVFTQIDKDKFVIHAEVMKKMKLYLLAKKGERGEYAVCELRRGLQRALEELLEIPEVKLIQCGGQDRTASAREQWNDGANTLCVAPGTVIAYDRNRITNQIMEDQGIRVIEIPSAELSRGRGGARCMSMPLLRETV